MHLILYSPAISIECPLLHHQEVEGYHKEERCADESTMDWDTSAVEMVQAGLIRCMVLISVSRVIETKV
jgi:hypothetical protein